MGTKKQVKGILETLCALGYRELTKKGAFVLPGFAKFVVVKKPATKARKGVNPFTGEPTVFKAKPKELRSYEIVRFRNSGHPQDGTTAPSASRETPKPRGHGTKRRLPESES